MEMSEDQKVIALLVASGNVEQEKVIETRKLARSLIWSDSGLTMRAADFACTHRENHEMYFNNGDSFCRHCGQPLSR